MAEPISSPQTITVSSTAEASQPILDAPLPPYPDPVPGTPESYSSTHSGLIDPTYRNYLLVVIGLFLFAVFVGALFTLQKRKTKRKMAQSGAIPNGAVGDSGRTNDTDWEALRRMPRGGGWRHARLARRLRGPRRAEGLDEFGNAPPAYEPRFKSRDTHVTEWGTAWRLDPATGLAIPDRVYDGHQGPFEMRTLKPSGYEETIRSFGSSKSLSQLSYDTGRRTS